jgi:hypothetical protein
VWSSPVYMHNRLASNGRLIGPGPPRTPRASPTRESGSGVPDGEPTPSAPRHLGRRTSPGARRTGGPKAAGLGWEAEPRRHVEGVPPVISTNQPHPRSTAARGGDAVLARDGSPRTRRREVVPSAARAVLIVDMRGGFPPSSSRRPTPRMGPRPGREAAPAREHHERPGSATGDREEDPRRLAGRRGRTRRPKRRGLPIRRVVALLRARPPGGLEHHCATRGPQRQRRDRRPMKSGWRALFGKEGVIGLSPDGDGPCVGRCSCASQAPSASWELVPGRHGVIRVRRAPTTLREREVGEGGGDPGSRRTPKVCAATARVPMPEPSRRQTPSCGRRAAAGMGVAGRVGGRRRSGVGQPYRWSQTASSKPA